MSAILLSNLLGALVINDSDSWEKADSIEQKVSDLAEAIEHSGLNPDVRQEMLKHLFMIESLRDISTPKHGVAEGVASGEPTTQQKDKPAKTSLMHLIVENRHDSVVLTNTATDTVEYLSHEQADLLRISYMLRKLGFDISPLTGIKDINQLKECMFNLGAQFIN